MVWTDGNAEIRVDEGVVYQVSHILEGLPMVFAGTVREQQLELQTTAMLNATLKMQRAAWPFGHFSPPVEVGLGKMHHEQRHLKRCQHQQHLGDESKDIRNNPPPPPLLLHLHFRSQTHP